MTLAMTNSTVLTSALSQWSAVGCVSRAVPLGSMSQCQNKKSHLHIHEMVYIQRLAIRWYCNSLSTSLSLNSLREQFHNRMRLDKRAVINDGTHTCTLQTHTHTHTLSS